MLLSVFPFSISIAQITLKTNSKTILEVMKEIEKNTSYRFFYNDDLPDLNKQISLDVTNESVKAVLDKMITQSAISYIIKENNQIILSAKSILQANKKQIRGTVTDENGEPVIGANIVEKGTTNGITTNLDGQFIFSVFPNSMLQVSYIGYIKQEVLVKNQDNFKIILKEDAKNIDEVIVVGYGTQKKVNLTGAVTAFTGEDLSRRQVGQSSMLLQGLAPGVVITQQNGQPGKDGGSISIRGKTTISGGSEPLILVDGIEMGLNNIDPSLIESISILKDAASASIYGVRAANGVILVTTKRAKKDHFSVNYNGYAGWQSPTTVPKVVNALDHMNMINEAYTNIGSSPLYTDEYIKEYIELRASNRDKYPDTDWYDVTLTGSGFMQSHFLSVSGGSERIRGLVSLGYLDQKGIIENTDYKRYTLRINTDIKLTNTLSAWADANIRQSEANEPSQGTSSIFHYIMRVPSNLSARLSDGLWGEGWNGNNPKAWAADGGLRSNTAPAVTLNLGMKYQPTDWLYADIMFAPNYWQSDVSRFGKSLQTYRWDGTPGYLTRQYSTLTEESVREHRNLLKAAVNAEKGFDKHNIKGLMGYQQESYSYKFLSGYREHFLFADYPVLNSGGEENQKSGGTKAENALQSLFARVNYSFADRYLLEANIRMDASSRFAPRNRVGYFPSVSVGWRISEEAFWLPFADIVDHLKIRASWGQLGNQDMGNYPTSSVVNLENPKYVFDKVINKGAALTAMANQDLVWERTTAYNIGIDASLFRHLSIVAEYYYKVSNDILMQLDIPPTIGLTKPWQNAGKMENRGWDLAINYTNWENEFKYEIGFNISDVKNKILDLKGVNGTGITANREGYSMSSIYALEAIGLISENDFDENGKYKYATQTGTIGPGDIKYKNQNPGEDNVINTDDQIVLGNTLPRFTYGINAQLSYKGFDFGLQLQGVGKVYGYLYGQGVMPFVEGGTVQEMHKKRWTKENPDPNAPFPRFAFNQANNQTNSSFWMKDASYLRIKNIQLGYSIPKKIINKLGIQNLRIYVSGQNILTFDNFWEGYDVEAPVGNGGYYPQMKSYCFGLDLSF